MNKNFGLFLIMLLFASVTNSQEAEGYNQVSLIKLIVVPEDFVGQKIRVKGYFKLGMFASLHLNHLSADIDDWASSIEVVDQTNEGELSLSCNAMYVVLRGRFVKNEQSFAITEITNVFNAKSLKPCWVESKNPKNPRTGVNATVNPHLFAADQIHRTGSKE